MAIDGLISDIKNSFFNFILAGPFGYSCVKCDGSGIIPLENMMATKSPFFTLFDGIFGLPWKPLNLTAHIKYFTAE